MFLQYLWPQLSYVDLEVWNGIPSTVLYSAENHTLAEQKASLEHRIICLSHLKHVPCFTYDLETQQTSKQVFFMRNHSYIANPGFCVTKKLSIVSFLFRKFLHITASI
jgi:hypothetical protein